MVETEWRGLWCQLLGHFISQVVGTECRGRGRRSGKEEGKTDFSSSQPPNGVSVSSGFCMQNENLLKMGVKLTYIRLSSPFSQQVRNSPKILVKCLRCYPMDFFKNREFPARGCECDA